MYEEIEFKYYRPESGQEVEDARSFMSDARNPEYVVREAAYDYHRRGGYEASWPIEFVILDSNYNELGRYEVERDIEPVFTAKLLKQQDRSGL